MPPAGSAAAAVYTVVPAATPSFTLELTPEVIVGARSFTLIVTAWVGSLIASYAGPGSFVGGLITSLGLNLSPSSTAAYFLGLAIILGGIFVLGLVVESGVRHWVSNSFDWLMMRIPLISNIYDLSKRFVAIVDRGDLATSRV